MSLCAYCDVLKYTNIIKIWIVKLFKKLAEGLILLQDDRALNVDDGRDTSRRGKQLIKVVRVKTNDANAVNVEVRVESEFREEVNESNGSNRSNSKSHGEEITDNNEEESENNSSGDENDGSNGNKNEYFFL
ncbi:hypothetical protein GH714_017704 [Hevea brasiliensis]|uniref:Uncharacterized protein n=1 Tax=Hevea brasiliensis TaxID=3981 RepID=A0A6A6M8D9_HEVBR|nr:hypothetical protein GH714_017704 [Hevea brasiliensis]